MTLLGVGTGHQRRIGGTLDCDDLFVLAPVRLCARMDAQPRLSLSAFGQLRSPPVPGGIQT